MPALESQTASISFINHSGEQRISRQSCGYGLLCLGYVSMEQLSTGTWNCLVQDCYCILGNHRCTTASGYLLSHVNIWHFRALWPI